jgi:hypothetical protein
MKANELRIGNLIFDAECEPNVFKVEEIKKHIGFENWIFYRNGSIKAKEVEGIPLNEEWLKKFGFEPSNEKDKYYFLGNNIAVSCADNKIKFIMGNFICSLVLSEIQYVHQLQNLFYCLTNQELTIKEATK